MNLPPFCNSVQTPVDQSAAIRSTLSKAIVLTILLIATPWAPSLMSATEPGNAPAKTTTLRLDATQAKGGNIIQTDKGHSAVFFQPAAPVKDKIVWKLDQPLPAGLWRVDLEFYQPESPFSPDQMLLFEGAGGEVLGNLNLYYIGFTKGTFTRSVGFYSDKPLAAVALLKSGQRNLDTVSVISITLTPATAATMDKLQFIFQLPVTGQHATSPIPLPTGVYVVNTATPVALRWDLPGGRNFTTPLSGETRVYLDQPAQPVLVGGEAVRSIALMRYPLAESPQMEVAGNPPLMTVTDPAKVETHTLVLTGYRGSGVPKLDLLPGGKPVAVVTSWDDGPLSDFPLSECLNQYGVKGTLYMNHGSPVVSRLRELEAKGMEIGSHSWSHAAFYNSSPKRCLDEAAEMRRFLEKELGHPVISFAYPFNYQPAYDAEGDYVLRSLRQAGYWSGRVTTNGDNRIDAIPEPLEMRPNFHFKAAGARTPAKFEELLQKPGSIYYIWGHSYELAGDGKKILEEDLAIVAHRPDVWYATLGELTVWQFLRNQLKIEGAPATMNGQAFTIKMPWVHPYLRQVPMSLTLPEGVKSVSWDGKSLPVVDQRVQLAW